jgi:UPF0271 protein
MQIDINCDMGEGYGAWTIGNDAALMPYISSANIACGFHAGDPVVMRDTIQLALSHKVAVGAHPSYPDLQGFGRRAMRLSPAEVHALVLYQVGALKTMLEALGGRLHHVKPHGALYNTAAREDAIAEAIARAVRDADPSLILYGLAGSALIHTAQRIGLPCAEEAFADRTYQPDGSLTPRSDPGALVGTATEAAGQVLDLVREGMVTTMDGRKVEVRADTVCIHGDGPRALDIAQTLQRELTASGIIIRPYTLPS